MDDQTILSLATGRKKILENVLQTLKGNLSSDSIPQHLLIRGPRGMGKSFFLKYLQINFKNEKLFSNAEFILLPEEQTNLNTPSDLIRLILNTANNAPIQDAAPMWNESDDLWQHELEKFKEYIANKKKANPDYLLVVVLENLDGFIKNIESDKKKKKVYVSAFRHLLEKIECFSFIGAVPQIDSDVDSDYNSRLFHAFKKCNLRPWAEQDYVKYFNRRKEVVEQQSGKVFNKSEASQLETKLKVISLYTGGSPRMAVVLTNLLLDDDVVTTANTLNGLIDDLTPYYQDLTKSIPKNSKILFDALIRHGENMSQSELAKAVGASQSQISKAFSWLKENGYVDGKKRSDSPAYIYSVKDRIHVLYHMQREIHYNQSVSSIWLLCDFLVSFYSPEEIRLQALQQLKTGSNPKSNDLARVYLLSKKLLDKDELLSLHPIEGWEKIMKEDNRISEIYDLITFTEWEDNDDSLRKCEELIVELFLILESVSNSQLIGNYIGVVYDCAENLQSSDKKLYKFSLSIGRKLFSFIQKNKVDWDNYFEALTTVAMLVGLNLFYLNQYSEAIPYLNKIIEQKEFKIKTKFKTTVLSMLGSALLETGRIDKAIKYITESIGSCEKTGEVELSAYNYFDLANCLVEIEQFEGAFEAIEKAYDLFSKFSEVTMLTRTLVKMGDVSFGLNKYQDSIGYYLKSSKHYEETNNVYMLGLIYSKIGKNLTSLKNYTEALKILKKSNNYFQNTNSREEYAANLLLIAINYSCLENEEEALNFFKQSFNLLPNDQEGEMKEFLFGLILANSSDPNVWENSATKVLEKKLDSLSVFKYIGIGILGFGKKNKIAKSFEIGNRMLNLIPNLFEGNLVTKAIKNFFLGLMKAKIKSSVLFDLCEEALHLFPDAENQLILNTVKHSIGYVESGNSEVYLEKLNPDMIVAIKEIVETLKSEIANSEFLI